MIGKTILLFAVWIGLTNSFDMQEMGVGLVLSLGVAYFFGGDEKLHLATVIIKYIKFAPKFIKALIQSNIAVAKIVLTPDLPINPGIIKLKTTLQNDYDKLILANAITLTPGTITIDLRGEDIYIHVLNLKTTDRHTLQRDIIESFEVL
jgi:multicomponent Na+:H+ antiporter subunit E